MSAATVTVRGQAVVSGQPDEARVAVVVSSRRPTPDEALSDVSADSEELERILGELAVDETVRRTSGASVTADTRYDRDTHRDVHLGYRATNQVTVRLNEARLVGKLLHEVTNRIGAQVQGPHWQLALTNPAFTEAARQAAEDARRKADAYAAALGVRLGTVERVSEPHVSAHRYDFPMEEPVVASLAAPEPQIEIHQGALDVTGAVEVTFNLEQG